MKEIIKDNRSVASIMELIKEGDEAAFALLFKKMWRPLYTRAVDLLGSRNIAEDIVQDVWVDLWKRRSEVQNDNVEAYLYKAVTFKVYKELRDTKFSTSQLEILEQLPTQIDSSEQLQLADTKNKIEVILNQLPSKCKEVFILSRFKGLKNAEISVHLNISQRTVEAHISKALKTMRKKMSYLFSFL